MSTWDGDGETVPRASARAALPRRIKVEVVAGMGVGASAVSEDGVISIGRAPGAQLRLEDPSASRFHCELELVRDGVRLRDLQSRNGTHFAGARVESITLPLPSVFQIGATKLSVTDAGVHSASVVPPTRFGALVGQSAAMRAAFARLDRLARTELSVCIEGPTGTGKELAARAVHEASARRAGPFVVVDCATIPAGLAESALFGHEKGAFTGAHQSAVGAFEAAHEGTIFLDEIGELSKELQPKLLRMLERREVVRVGSVRPRPVNVRVLTATWRDLRAMVNDGTFREDLYFRLAHARVSLPPLHERVDDIPLLIEHFLATRAAPIGAQSIEPEALAELSRREYRGNVRELRATVERLAALADGPRITADDVKAERVFNRESREDRAAVDHGPDDDDQAPIEDFKDAKRTVMDAFERRYLERLMLTCEGNLSRAARIAGLERHSLRDLLRRHGLRADR